MCGFVSLCVWVCVCVGLSLSARVGLGLCVWVWICVCTCGFVCVCSHMVLYLSPADRKVDVHHHTSLPWFDPVSPGCICLTSLSGYRVRLGAFILIAYDGLFILLVSDASFIHYLCTFWHIGFGWHMLHCYSYLFTCQYIWSYYIWCLGSGTHCVGGCGSLTKFTSWGITLNGMRQQCGVAGLVLESSLWCFRHSLKL